MKNVAVTEVFKEIEKQTTFRFLYRDELVKKAGLVSVTVKDGSVQEALDQCFARKPLDYRIFKETIVISEKAAALANQGGGTGMIEVPVPTIDVTGRVLNEQGKPVEGVTVTIKNTNKATTTNANGEFFLNSVEQDAVLVFTSVNMEPFELKVSGKTELVVNLKAKVTELGDVTVTVNTGYQQIPKERSTGAFEFVNNEELNRKPGADLLTRLEGVTTGILFDRRALPTTQSVISPGNILIRGLNTLTAGMKTPLIVVDKFPYDGDINNINPNDVETITILKDAAAASIWGARAANGVIVITTKRGQYNQPFSVSVNANARIVEKPDQFSYPKMSSSEFIDMEKFLFDKGFYNSALASQTYAGISPAVEIYQKLKLGAINDQQAAAEIAKLESADVRDDFDKYVYRSGLGTQYALQLSGGSSNIRYSFSGGYDKILSILKRDDQTRITARSAATIIPIKNLELELGFVYTHNKSNNNSLGDIGSQNYNYGVTKRLYPYARFIDEQGNYLTYAKDYRIGYTDTAGAGRLLNWGYRPLEELNLADNSSTHQDLVMNFGITYKFNKSLNAQLSYQYENTTGLMENLYSEQTYFARNLINLYSQISNSGNVTYKLPRGGILDTRDFGIKSHNGRAQINFSKNWADHQINMLGGGEIREVKATDNLQRLYGFNPNTYSNSLVDYTTVYPQYGKRGNRLIPDRSGRSLTTDHFVSLYANIGYTYKNKYSLTSSARKDAANIFGVETNRKWKPFWTIGGSWDVSKEAFFTSNTIQNLRLRLTYGYQGNVNNSLSPYTIIGLQSAASNFVNEPWASIGTPANPQLSWERVGQTNFGIDLRAFKSRVVLGFDIFYRKSNNLLWEMPIDYTTGWTTVKSNNAAMSGKGIELALNTLNFDGAFKWNSEFGFTYNTFKVTDYDTALDENLTIQGIVGNGGMNIIGLRGRSPYSVFSYSFAGLDPATGDPLGHLGKSTSKDYLSIFRQLYDTANVIYHGSAIPTYFGYFNNIFRYRNFSLLVSISYKMGYYFRKSTISYFALYQQGVQHSDFSKRWQEAGDEAETTVPSMIYPLSNSRRDDFYANSSANILKGDHVRLQNIKFSYQFSSRQRERQWFKAIQLYVNFENLGIIWRANDEKLDPDYDNNRAPFPVSRVYTTGLKMDF
jgi:TonB-dependent starch-binding outer membrane protein SusC